MIFLIAIGSLAEWKTLWILISWLLKKPADLDPQCFLLIRISPGSAGQGLRTDSTESVCLCWKQVNYIDFDV